VVVVNKEVVCRARMAARAFLKHDAVAEPDEPLLAMQPATLGSKTRFPRLAAQAGRCTATSEPVRLSSA
jgi:hypothetical protein